MFRVTFVLLSIDLTYSRIPGDQGGPLFFKLEEFFSGGRFTYKWVEYNFFLDTNSYATCPNLRKIVCNEVVFNEFVLVLLQIDIY